MQLNDAVLGKQAFYANEQVIINKIKIHVKLLLGLLVYLAF